MRECVDFYRYWGTEKITNKKFRKSPLEVKFLYYYRILHGLEVCGKSKKSLTYKYYAKKYKMIKERSHISISYSTQIGEGFYIGHTGRVIINSDSILGKNVNIATGCIIGVENRGIRKGCPKIGNCVWIGSNSVIVGNISIGDDVLIAPLTFVNFDVPSHSIVIGNPARIIYRENATDGYINNVICEE